MLRHGFATNASRFDLGARTDVVVPSGRLVAARPRCPSRSTSTIATTSRPTSCGFARVASRAPDTWPQPLPDIAVEIRSPSTWRYDIGPKKRRYEQHGLPELWLVDTDADEIFVFRRSAGRGGVRRRLQLARGDELTSPQLPGFALALDALFGPKTRA